MAGRHLSEKARSRLKYVQVPTGSLSLDRFPDFLLIGPQRTATTWIRRSLRCHPQILWARTKEPHFFSHLRQPEHPRFESAELSWYLDLFRDPFSLFLLKHALSLLGTGSFYRPLVRGEATASYAVMDRDLIEEVVTLNPDIRAVMMIRHPIERAWSHAKKDLVREPNRRIEEVSDEEFKAFFRKDYLRKCAQYVANYDRWSSCLKQGHILVGRFEDVRERPVELLAKICGFLGVKGDRRFFGRKVHRVVNPTSPEPVPEQHRRFLAELLTEDIEEAKGRFGIAWD